MEDEKEKTELIQSVVEAIIAVINPEVYKKYKNRDGKHEEYENDKFIDEIKEKTGMSKDEASKLLSDNPEYDIVMDPIITKD